MQRASVRRDDPVRWPQGLLQVACDLNQALLLWDARPRWDDIPRRITSPWHDILRTTSYLNRHNPSLYTASLMLPV